MAFTCRGGFKTEEFRLSSVQLLILAQLKHQASHGYMLMQHLQENLEGWSLKSGTVYPALHRLVNHGLIKGVNVEQDDRPDAIEYHLTKKGRRVLNEVLHGLDSEISVQESLWRFLGAVANQDHRKAVLHWSSKKRSPMGFVFMKRQCENGCCGPVHLDFLKEYRDYLKQELSWVDKKLKDVKSSKTT